MQWQDTFYNQSLVYFGLVMYQTDSNTNANTIWISTKESKLKLKLELELSWQDAFAKTRN